MQTDLMQTDIDPVDEVFKEHPVVDYMRSANKNIPINSKLVKELPYGFTPTGIFPTKKLNFKRGGSKFFDQTVYNVSRKKNYGIS